MGVIPRPPSCLRYSSSRLSPAKNPEQESYRAEHSAEEDEVAQRPSCKKARSLWCGWVEDRVNTGAEFPQNKSAKNCR